MTDGQFAGVLGVATTFLASVIATAKWIADRFAKALDASTAQRGKDTEALAALRAEVIALREMVRESRDDMREARALVEQLAAERPRGRQRINTDRSGVPRARSSGGDDT